MQKTPVILALKRGDESLFWPMVMTPVVGWSKEGPGLAHWDAVPYVWARPMDMTFGSKNMTDGDKEPE
jgi:hypothetical protein